MQQTVNAIEIFDEIIDIHNSDEIKISDKYSRYRRVLEIVCKDFTKDEPVHFSNLFSRLSYIIEKYKIDKHKRYQIHSFRIKANKILHDGEDVNNNEYQTHLKGLCEFISFLYKTSIPEELVKSFPTRETYQPKKHKKSVALRKVRVEVIENKGDYLICNQDALETDSNIIVRINVPGINDTYSFYNKIWEGAQLNLLNVDIDEKGHFIPKILILEPDYLLDISAIAECFQEYGFSSLNYIKSKFTPVPNTKHIRLGNYANHAIDTLIYEQLDDANTAKSILIDDFKQYPFEYTTCKDIKEEASFKKFMQDCNLHYNNLRQTIREDFPSLSISKDNVTLEPAFLSEDYGIQGRLDVFESNNGIYNIIELKSGSPPFPDDGKNIKSNHLTQLYLYYQVIQSIKKISFSETVKKIQGYILYSKSTEGSIRYDQPALKRIQEIFDLRNQIIVNEHQLANSDIKQVNEIINNISPNTLITRNINPKFRDKYIIPQIKSFTEPVGKMNDIERKYFNSFVSFIAREQFYAKTGSPDPDQGNDLADLWLNSFEEKKEKFDILYDLKIIENRVNKDEKSLVLKRTNKENEFANFRKGDICVFYPRENEKTDVRAHQILKCTITDLNKEKVTIKLRYKQKSLSYFEECSSWALEHDFLDTSFTSMYRSLYSFISEASDEKRNLLLGIKPPQKISRKEEISKLPDEHERVIYKAKNVNDYLLIWGPPGTGKTSIIIKKIVKEMASEPDKNILLLAYTNRAVDELCDAVKDAFGEEKEFIRIGSQFSCSENHRPYLLDNKIKALEDEGKVTREKIKDLIQSHQIYISTIASIVNKPGLFELVNFDIGIVDEASQILEPQILGLLSKLDRFILVGDHKQLPAIVLQEEEKTEVKDLDLQNLGINYLKNSLFERLYKLAVDKEWDWAYDRLKKQGRMHQDIASISNYSFYQNILKNAKEWQKKPFNYNHYDTEDALEHILAKRRLLFFPGYHKNRSKYKKANELEADLTVKIILKIKELYKKNGLEFQPQKTLGVITPYRNQIALIKTKLEENDVKDFEEITVDTVERFQGSQRDIILFSFVIHSPFQLAGIESLNDEGNVDRKLNVAITRARKQLIFTGDEAVLTGNFIYHKLIEYIKSNGGYVNQNINNVLSGTFNFKDDSYSDNPASKIYEPDSKFCEIYNELVINKIKQDKRTEYPQKILGNPDDFNRVALISYGRANFDQHELDFSPNQEFTAEDKVDLYCYYNMRKHYFSSYRIFDGYSEYFKKTISNNNNRVSFFDIGCGPATSGLAFNQFFSNGNDNFYLNYFGIDISEAMTNKANEFVQAGLFSSNHKAFFYKSFDQLEIELLEDIFHLPNLVIFNFSYLFSNLNINQTLEMYPSEQPTLYVTLGPVSFAGKNKAYARHNPTRRDVRPYRRMEEFRQNPKAI